MDLESWKKRREVAKENGLGDSIRDETMGLLTKSQSEQARSLLFLAELHDLDSDDSSAVFARFLSFLSDRDPRTLFLMATEAIGKEDYVYAIILCAFYLSEFSESEDLIRLMKAFAERKIGLIDESTATLSGVPRETSLWLGSDGLVSVESLL